MAINTSNTVFTFMKAIVIIKSIYTSIIVVVNLSRTYLQYIICNQYYCLQFHIWRLKHNFAFNTVSHSVLHIHLSCHSICNCFPQFVFDHTLVHRVRASPTRTHRNNTKGRNYEKKILIKYKRANGNFDSG